MRWHIPDVRGWLIRLFRLKTCPYCFSWSTAVCDRDRYGDGLDCTRAQFQRQPRQGGDAGKPARRPTIQVDAQLWDELRQHVERCQARQPRTGG